jgi:drug/metabolite transporter (DMT)-like permease
MIFVGLSGIFVALFSLVYKMSLRSRCDVEHVYRIMFIVSGIFGFILFLFPSQGKGWPLLVISLGLIAAFWFRLAVICYFKVIRLGQHSISWTVINLSISIPLLFSIFMWGEKPSIWQWLGLAGILVSIIFLGIDQLIKQNTGKGADHKKLSRNWLGFTFLAFLGTGIVQLLAKSLIQFGYSEYNIKFTMILYSGTALYSLFSIKDIEVRKIKKELVLGGYMAFTGVLAYIFLLLSLEDLEGFIVFPVRGIINIFLVIILSMILWREKLYIVGWIGLIIAMVSIVLIT